MFYSCHNTRSRRLQAAADELFEELDNGNLSDVDGECDDEGDSLELHGAAGATDEAQLDSESETSDDESGLGMAGGWKRRPFQTPNTAFQGDLDGVPAFEGGILEQVCSQKCVSGTGG